MRQHRLEMVKLDRSISLETGNGIEMCCAYMSKSIVAEHFVLSKLWWDDAQWSCACRHVVCLLP